MQTRAKKSGFTVIEVVTVLAIIVVVGVALFPSLRGRRSATELDLTARQMGALLREARERALLEASSTAWGVRFDNTATSTPFYALFAGAYDATTTVTRANLPARVRYASASVPAGSSREVLFALGTGRPAASTTIRLELTETAGSVTSTQITISRVGTISF